MEPEVAAAGSVGCIETLTNQLQFGGIVAGRNDGAVEMAVHGLHSGQKRRFFSPVKTLRGTRDVDDKSSKFNDF